MQVSDHFCRSLILTSNIVLRIMHKQRAGKCSDTGSGSGQTRVRQRAQRVPVRRAIGSKRSGVQCYLVRLWIAVLTRND